MNTYFFIILFFIPNLGLSQVFEMYQKITDSKDTTINLSYHKKIDSEITKKLDTFISSKKNRLNKYYKDSGFIQINLYNHPKKGLIGDFWFCSFYNHYDLLTQKKHNYNNVLSFTFYKSYLVIIITDKKNNLTVSMCDSELNLFKSIIYQEMSVSVKKEIDKKSDAFLISNNFLSKRFYFGNK